MLQEVLNRKVLQKLAVWEIEEFFQSLKNNGEHFFPDKIIIGIIINLKEFEMKDELKKGHKSKKYW